LVLGPPSRDSKRTASGPGPTRRGWASFCTGDGAALYNFCRANGLGTAGELPHPGWGPASPGARTKRGILFSPRKAFVAKPTLSWAGKVQIALISGPNMAGQRAPISGRVALLAIGWRTRAVIRRPRRSLAYYVDRTLPAICGDDDLFSRGKQIPVHGWMQARTGRNPLTNGHTQTPDHSR